MKKIFLKGLVASVLCSAAWAQPSLDISKAVKCSAKIDGTSYRMVYNPEQMAFEATQKGIEASVVVLDVNGTLMASAIGSRINTNEISQTGFIKIMPPGEDNTFLAIYTFQAGSTLTLSCYLTNSN